MHIRCWDFEYYGKIVKNRLISNDDHNFNELRRGMQIYVDNDVEKYFASCYLKEMYVSASELLTK